VFGAVINNAIDGIIGIDDLMVEVDKSCPEARRCDFESEDTCLWESIPPSLNSIARDQKLRWSKNPIGMDVKNNVILKTDFTWTVHSPLHATIDSNIHPDKDHTIGNKFGTYLALKNESPRKPLDRAV